MLKVPTYLLRGKLVCILKKTYKKYWINLGSLFFLSKIHSKLLKNQKRNCVDHSSVKIAVHKFQSGCGSTLWHLFLPGNRSLVGYIIID